MKILYFTNEYPPYVYGGAGIHIEFLSKEMAELTKVEVRCYGDQNIQYKNLKVLGFQPHQKYEKAPNQLRSVFATLDRDLQFVAQGIDADLVHCHTWYTHMAGIWAKLNYGIPLVITTHSLEPLRPWKREQLGGGYDFSCWVEKTALEMSDGIIAVSNETKKDILKYFNVTDDKIKVIHNGIDINTFKKVEQIDRILRFNIVNKPYVLFVGRITRQKGIIHLVNAIKHLNKDLTVVLCAGAPDTPEIAKEMEEGVSKAKETRENIIWIREMVDRDTLIQLYSHATVFCCPSIYEPFGIINLEAMACEVPVVASRVGGIPEVVVHEQTGLLVDLEQMQESPFEAIFPEKYAKDLADAINYIASNKELAIKMGKAGRKRVEEKFSWKSIANQTYEYYKEILAKKQLRI